MSDKGNNSVIKLIGNKLFITLLVFAIAIIMISAAFSRSVQKVAEEQPEYKTEEVPVTANTESEMVVDAVPETEVNVSVEEQETVPVIKEIRYRLPIAGELQKNFSVDELLWDETMQDWRTHNGIDIAAEDGAEVVTAAPGTVAEVFEDETYGISVKVLHDDNVVTVYKNLGKAVVEKNDILDEGQMIGTVGNTGLFEKAQTTHLHFEVILEDKNINPLEFIK